MTKDPCRSRSESAPAKSRASKSSAISRRDFLQWGALSAGAVGLGLSTATASAAGETVCLVVSPADPVASSEPVRWAAQELSHALADRSITLRRLDSISQASASGLSIVAAGRTGPLAPAALKQSALTLPDSPECLVLGPAHSNGRFFQLACGSDPRGLMYALLELADRVRFAENPLAVLKIQKPVAEQPFNDTRSIGRLFVSDVEDKPWFYDRDMWPAYFSMLATQRFNRFNLNFGIGYDTLEHVTDAYLLFAYPFLVAVPGYNVRAVNLPDAERDRNLETLQFISQQAVAHGIDFQLGIWTHGYQWRDSPNPNYTIAGLTPEIHAAYSRDALAALLQACPAISGVTIRTHGESGVPEGSYSFWKTVFEGVPKSGRQVEIDLHTKGLDEAMIDGALSTGMPLRLSPKYWAEHMGMPYQQTAIRELEMAEANPHPQGYYALSTGSRSFTRYGYADFLREDRPYTVMFRIWPGTHRFLLWGDPATSAAHARAFRFCGCNGVELFEPLSFKGRRGSGLPGGRCAYADSSLRPHWDWEKYLYTYRTWGRLLYNPEAAPDVWRRSLRREFQAKAPAVEASLAAATRIVPIITAAHLPSAANDTYGPEFYTNQSMLDPSQWYPYGDTPAPKIFANVSPLDPQVFSRMSDFAGELLHGERTGKYSPIEVAQWLEDLAQTADEQLTEAENLNSSPEFRRLAADVRLQIGLGRFFATKFRSGVLFAIHDQSGDRSALEESLNAYRRAREVWSHLAEGARDIYVLDITFGPRAYQRGHWRDRLAAIDADIAEMAKRLQSAQAGSAPSARVQAAIREALGRPHRSAMPCVHTPPAYFTPDQPLQLVLSVPGTAKPNSVRLYYRHVNQAEHYQTAEMELQGKEYQAMIPGSYAGSTYPLQYYFELKEGPEKACLYPGFHPDLANQPYFVVRNVPSGKAAAVPFRVTA
jgi:hypothetical protein